MLKLEAAVPTRHMSGGAVKRQRDVGEREFGCYGILVNGKLHTMEHLSRTVEADCAAIHLHWHGDTTRQL